VLKEPGASEQVLVNRAKVSTHPTHTENFVTDGTVQALLICGAIFKSTMPDESDEERRELER
jgi:hypothetical protein